jgi:hypothetical protein
VFERQWPAWLSGIFLAGLALAIFMWWHTWGVAGGYNNWGDWILYHAGIYSGCPAKTPLANGMSVSNIGIVAGAFAAALLGNQFRVYGAPLLEYGKGFAGGVLMGVGAALAAGCNVGGFYSALGMFDLGGFGMMLGLFAGAYLGLRYLLWELEHLPQKSGLKTPECSVEGGLDWCKVLPFLGVFVVVLILVGFQVYSSLGLTQMGGLLFFGFLIGLVMQRGRFCFANAFREPFMTGDSRMMRAVLLSLMLYLLGTAVIKWSYIQPPSAGVYHPFLLGSLIGGVIFGFGMLLAGGCATGTLWRVGEGQTKLWVAMAAFFLSNSPASRLLQQSGAKGWLGSGVFAPELLGWQVSLILLYGLCVFLMVALLWNEKTERLVLF